LINEVLHVRREPARHEHAHVEFFGSGILFGLAEAGLQVPQALRTLRNDLIVHGLLSAKRRSDKPVRARWTYLTVGPGRTRTSNQALRAQQPQRQKTISGVSKREKPHRRSGLSLFQTANFATNPRKSGASACLNELNHGADWQPRNHATPASIAWALEEMSVPERNVCARETSRLVAYKNLRLSRARSPMRTIALLIQAKRRSASADAS
jgi:hypothetical protein